MGLLSTTLNSLGVLFLSHAVYSSYEHSASHTNPTLLAANPSLAALPTDIVLEVLFSVTLLCVGIVLASPQLRPIQWNVWASQIEKDERREKSQRVVWDEATGGLVINPYRWLEERKGFWDVRGKRKEFADWIRDGSGAQKAQ